MGRVRRKTALPVSIRADRRQKGRSGAHSPEIGGSFPASILCGRAKREGFPVTPRKTPVSFRLVSGDMESWTPDAMRNWTPS